MQFDFIKLQSKDIQDYFQEIAQLRIEIFKEFPYLYQGSFDYERNYLCRYIEASDSLVCLVKQGDIIAGMTTAISLAQEDQDIKGQYQEQGYIPEHTCYFGESIIKKEYRNYGVGKQFFKIREEFAIENIPKLKHTTFCAVKRDHSHPLRPENYFDLSEFWSKQGYQKTESHIKMKWKDINKDKEDYKKLMIWKKSF